MAMVFNSTLISPTFFHAYVLLLLVRVRLAEVKARFWVYLLHLLCFYQGYCTLVMRYCYVTRGA